MLSSRIKLREMILIEMIRMIPEAACFEPYEMDKMADDINQSGNNETELVPIKEEPREAQEIFFEKETSYSL